MVVEAKVVRLLATRLRCPLCLSELDEPPVAAVCPGCATACHAACVAELGVACPTLGCAVRRGGGVVVRPRVGLLWPLVLTWLLFGPLWPGALAAWGWALWRARRRRRRVALALLASPFVVVPACSVGVAVAGYSAGTATLTSLDDLDGKRRRGYDPELRCGIDYVSCHVTFGPELLSIDLHEAVLRGLLQHLGPMPGAYTGPIPSRVEAHALLQRRVTTSCGPEGPVLFADPQEPPGRLFLVVEGRLLPIDVGYPGDLWPLVSPGSDRECRIGRAVPIDGLEQALLVAGADTNPWAPPGETALLVDLVHRRVVCRLWASPEARE